MALAAKNMVRSNVGRSWMAVRDMDVAAEVIGIRLMRTKLLAFAVSSFYCGVAGALYAYAYLGTVEPEAFNLDLSFRILFMVIIGGVGSILGSFLGAAFIIAAADPAQRDRALPRHQRFSLRIPRARSSNLELMVFGGLIIFFLIVEPHGLARLWQIAQGEAAAVAVPALNGSAAATVEWHGVVTLECGLRDAGIRRSYRYRICQEEQHEGDQVGAAGRRAARGGTAASAQNEQFMPMLSYRVGPYAAGGSGYFGGAIDYWTLVNMTRRHQRREADVGGVRDRVQRLQGRRVLRAPEEEERRRHDRRAAVHRHHLRAARPRRRRTRSR